MWKRLIVLHIRSNCVGIRGLNETIIEYYIDADKILLSSYSVEILEIGLSLAFTLLAQSNLVQDQLALLSMIVRASKYE